MDKPLDQAFIDVYTKFKLQFYRKIFGRFESREATLTAVETFCVEVINALGHPTIGDFAKFVDISQANATYKVQSLIKKGYVAKQRSDTDKREYRLAVTKKFNDYAKINTDYVGEVVNRIRQRLSPEELRIFQHTLEVINQELMPEISLQ
ncbi:MAG: MarR family transcriptional regulator [Coriobacteriales bacterium]|nr:MarR family transcriptional regulator [Coriobacteriales bacterium]